MTGYLMSAVPAGHRFCQTPFPFCEHWRPAFWSKREDAEVYGSSPKSGSMKSASEDLSVVMADKILVLSSACITTRRHSVCNDIVIQYEIYMSRYYSSTWTYRPLIPLSGHPTLALEGISIKYLKKTPLYACYICFLL